MKTDLATARREMRSPNIKTRKRALKIIHDYKRNLRFQRSDTKA
ncbi:putative metal homeostasis protein [Agrilactobacillus fermenti]|nr:putative metal homeostasis protein [Agrilactobacillus fermenti]MCD2256965.1 putative metal homeostasis protein [Agrilactobacillus fermenti]